VRRDPHEPAEAPAFVLEDQVGFRVRKVHQRVADVFAEVMAGFDVTPTQFSALVKLREAGPVPQSQLGRLIAVDPATIFGVVGRLAKRGYVEQAVSAADARVTLVGLTPAGREAAARMVAVADEVSRRVLEPLAEPERRALLDLLAKLE